MLRDSALETDLGFNSLKNQQHLCTSETTTNHLLAQNLVSSGPLPPRSPEDERCEAEATVKRKLSRDGLSPVVPLLDNQRLSKTSLALNRTAGHSVEDPITSGDHFPCPSSTVASDSISQAIFMDGLGIDRISERQRFERRKHPYPQTRSHTSLVPKVFRSLTDFLTSLGNLSHNTNLSTESFESTGAAKDGKAGVSTCSSDSIPSADDYKSDVQWANESHLTRAVIYSVHSVSNGSVSFTPLGITVSSTDADAVNYLMAYANHVNSLFGAPQKEREKAKSDWVQKWLTMSYKRMKDSTVSRQAMYSSYAESCKVYNMIPQNSASFGKAVRTAFPNIRTRRLGRRGDSRYHYISIAARLDCEARRLNEFGDPIGALHQNLSNGESTLQRMDDDEEDAEAYSEDESYQDGSGQSLGRGASSTSVSEDQHEIDEGSTSPISTLLKSSAIDLSKRSSIVNVAGFPSRETEMYLKDAEAWSMWDALVEHLDKLLAYFEEYSLDHFEMTMRVFWPSMTLYRNVSQGLELSTIIAKAMAICYDEMISMLTAKVFTSRLSAALPNLRKFAKCMETICHVSLKDYDRTFSEQKIELAARAGHLILRFCDIQLLTGALVPIMSEAVRIKDMLRAWAAIDFGTLLDQAALACNCQPIVLETILEDFREILGDALSRTDMSGAAAVTLGRIGERLEEVTTLPGLGLSPRSLLIRVSFVTSQIMRDMTLRSDPAFGLFQLLKTWVDDWCGLLILRKVALCNGSFEALDVNTTVEDIPTPSGGRDNTRLP